MTVQHARNSQRQRALAAIIRRPTGSQLGGGAAAGRALSKYVAQIAPIDCAEMSTASRSEPWEGYTYHYCEGYSAIPDLLTRLIPPLRMREMNALTLSTIPEQVRQDQYSVVHIHNLHPIWAAFQVARACKRIGKPYVLACHGIHEVANMTGFQGLMGMSGFKAIAGWVGGRPPLRYLVKNSSLIYASSPADFPVLDKLGANPNVIRVVPNGVDQSFFQDIPDGLVDHLRQKYGLPAGKPIALFVGHVRQNKGIDILIKAMSGAATPYHALVVGPHTFPDYIAELRTLAQGLGLTGQLTFTGEVPLEELPGFHQLADIFVFPSRQDTLPLAVLEAMSKAKPIIATRIGGIPYQLADHAGILIEPDHPDQLRDAIEQLLSNSQLRHTMGQAARQRLLDNFTWERAAHLAVEGYREIARL